jgi:hypothetical protein
MVFGVGLNSVLSPLIATSPDRLPILLFGEAVLSAVVALVTVSKFPSDPSVEKIRLSELRYAEASMVRPPGPAEAPGLHYMPLDGPGLRFGESVAACLRNRSFIVLATSSGFLANCFQCWQAVLPVLLERPPLAYSEAASNHLYALSTATMVLGSYSVGEVADRWFHRRLRALVLICAGTAAALFGVLLLQTAAAEKVFNDNKTRDGWVDALLLRVPCSFTAVAIVAGILGAAVGAVVPPALELAAEMTFPAPEGASANLIMVAMQIGGFGFLAASPYLAADPCGPGRANTCMLLIAIFCFVSVATIRESYDRTDSRERII